MELFFKDELIYCDGPLVFTAIDINNRLYFVNLYEIGKDVDIYIAAPTNTQEIRNWRLKDDNCWDIFKKNEWYVVEWKNNGLRAIRQYIPMNESKI